MKLNNALLLQLIRDTDGAPLKVVLGDACELLTTQIVLFIRSKVRQLEAELPNIPPKTPERYGMAGRINGLKKLMVELAEAP